jgi:nucleoside-diphosphate-sugar epimerase
MKALVVGGGGFVGSAVVRQLLDKGAEVAVFGRSHYAHLEELDVHQIQGDILDSDLLIRAMRGYDTVFHVAAKAGVWGPKHEYEQINVTGTRNVLGACFAAGVASLVYTSTPDGAGSQFRNLKNLRHTPAPCLGARGPPSHPKTPAKGQEQAIEDYWQRL